MSMMLLTVGAFAQSDNKNCCDQKRPAPEKFAKKPHMRRCPVNVHAMKEAGVDSVTIAKVFEFCKDTTLCKDREAMNKKIRKELGTETYIKYLENAAAHKPMKGDFRGHRGHHGHGKHPHHKGPRDFNPDKAPKQDK